MEYRKLNRRFGGQPSNFSQAKKLKVHELVDDAENDPNDNPGGRSLKQGGSKPQWDSSKKVKLNLPQLVNNNSTLGAPNNILRGSASVQNYAKVVKHQDGLGIYPSNR